MKLTISFKNIKHTKELDELIQAKVDKLDKFFQGKTHVTWISFCKDGHLCSEVRVVGPTFRYQATARSSELTKTLDMVMAKIQKQIQKKHSQWKNKIHHKHEVPLKEAEVIQFWEHKERKAWWDEEDEDMAA